MPFYNFFYEVSEGGSLDKKEWIDGDLIEWVQIKIPSGQRGTLKIRLLYGEYQIIPYEPGQWVFGDDDSLLISDLIPIEGKRYPLRIIAVNESTCYPRRFWLRVQTKFEEQLLWTLIGDSVYSAITKAFKVEAGGRKKGGR